MTYQFECQGGQDEARHVISEARKAGNLPRLVFAVRDAAKDETGYGVGFLFELCQEVIK